MKKISLFFIMIMVANTLFSQVIYCPNSSTKTAVMRRLGRFGFLEEQGLVLQEQGLSYTLVSGHRSFFTANYGVQTKTELGDYENENEVLFCFETKDQNEQHLDCPRIVSGTESIAPIVKESSSKSTFNGNVETSIDIHVGDVFSVLNVELHFFATFKVVSYDATKEVLIIEFVDNIVIESGNLVVPEYVELNNEKYLVTEIGNNAFNGCTNLTSITIPNSVTSIGYFAFYGCSGLTSLTIPESLDVSDCEIGFTKDGIRYSVRNGKEVIVVSNSYTGNIVIPSSVTAGNTFSVTGIGNSAFYRCIDLTSVTIPNSVTSIGEYAFTDCSGLTSVTIPNSVTSIGGFAFYDCSGLKEVINLSSLEISYYFSYYTDTDVYNGGKIAVGDFMFSKNDKILNQYVGSSANVVLPENFEGDSYTIGSYAFRGCSGLTSVTIPNSVTSIGGSAFSGCSGLTSLTIPNSVTSIGGSAFSGCSGLTSLTIPNSVTSIGGSAFSGCSGLTLLTIPNSVTSIGNYAFSGCSGLTSLTIPNSVTSIGGSAFSGCSGLTLLTIPNSVTSIGNYAFSGCTSLKNVVIGENVTTIGEKTFFDCSALSRVTCYAVNPPDADASSFSNYNGYLTIPCDNFEAYDIHPVWGSFKHVDCISGEATELQKDEVVVEPEINEAVFSMPTNASANSYTLTIQNNGVTFCTLTFNNQGQLANIDFSNSQLKAAVEGYQFTVTGLSAATGYNYSFKALDKNKSVLKEYTGSFTTKNADGTGGSSTTAIDDVELANAISIVNNQIFVNGEAPEFVFTSLGQKIANQNLKAGVYFVVVEGQSVKASIR